MRLEKPTRHPRTVTLSPSHTWNMHLSSTAVTGRTRCNGTHSEQPAPITRSSIFRNTALRLASTFVLNILLQIRYTQPCLRIFREKKNYINIAIHCDCLGTGQRVSLRIYVAYEKIVGQIRCQLMCILCFLIFKFHFATRTCHSSAATPQDSPHLQLMWIKKIYRQRST